jgi:uncharacterized protein
MRLAVQVKPGAHRDGLWRDGDGLFAHIRAVPHDGAANEYLLRYLSGSLRVAKSLIRIVRGQGSRHKIIEIKVSDADLLPILDSLDPVPQVGLFDGSE